MLCVICFHFRAIDVFTPHSVVQAMLVWGRTCRHRLLWNPTLACENKTLCIKFISRQRQQVKLQKLAKWQDRNRRVYARNATPSQHETASVTHAKCACIHITPVSMQRFSSGLHVFCDSINLTNIRERMKRGKGRRGVGESHPRIVSSMHTHCVVVKRLSSEKNGRANRLT
jgi:hypothetical protein